MQAAWVNAGGMAVAALLVAALLVAGLALGATTGVRRGSGLAAGKGAGLAEALGRGLEYGLVAWLVWLGGGWALWLSQGGSLAGDPLAGWSWNLGGWTLIHWDGLTWLLSGLVGFLGWMIVRFSRHYLAGDIRQLAFWGWFTATLAAVQAMLAAGNLLILLAAWTLVSLTLHQLLLFHAERPLARRAAGTKFTLSRLADLLLFVGAALLCWRAGTAELAGLRDWSSTAVGIEQQWLTGACVLLVLGAAIRSAQFPFHFWLPLTLDTPTPVSALMHAGIVNAGGFMAIRLSFLLVESPLAMNLLAALGLVTALLGGCVMLTQPSIKSALAWSTVAQMGFMMLQCGCGAFSAAAVHIVAHSLYKAHAFLGSGSVLVESSGLDVSSAPRGNLPRWQVALALAAACGLVVGAFGLMGVQLWSKAGGVLIAGALALAIAQWLLALARIPGQLSRSPRLWLRGGLFAIGMVAIYLLAWRGSESLLQPPQAELVGLAAPQFWVAGWGLVFAMLIWVRGDWSAALASPRLEAWRVHASQGFYCESLARRWFGGIAPSLLR